MDFFLNFEVTKEKEEELKKYAKFIHLRIWKLFLLTVMNFQQKKKINVTKNVSKSKEMRGKKIIFVFITTSSDDPLN